MRAKLILLLLQLLAIKYGRSQDLEQVVKSKWLVARGNVGLIQMLNRGTGDASQGSSFNYVFTGNLNLTLFGVVDAPFQMLYSNLGNAYTQPTFNQTAFHPKYKWVQVHVGRIAQSWSPYSLNGHVFQGAAIDLTPGKWTISALYGRFQKAIPLPDSSFGNMRPAYKRLGMGVRSAYQNRGSRLQLLYFHAQDDTGSIEALPFELGITPKSNDVFGVQWNQVLRRKWQLGLDISQSRMMNDYRTPQINAVHHAFKASLVHQGNVVQWNTAYERVDPDYQTLGAYYFNNDLENMTVGASLRGMKGKLQLSAQGGIQRDNLKMNKTASMLRNVYQAQLQYATAKRSMLSVMYSNFTSYTNARSFLDVVQPGNPMLAWDTLNFRQISQSANMQWSIPLQKSKQWESVVTGSALWQRETASLQGGSDFYNTALGFSGKHKKSGATVSFSYNTGKNTINEIVITNHCPVIAVNMAWAKGKARSTISVSQNRAYQGNNLLRETTFGRGQLSWAVSKRQSLQCSIQYQQLSPSRTVFQGMLGYQAVLQ